MLLAVLPSLRLRQELASFREEGPLATSWLLWKELLKPRVGEASCSTKDRVPSMDDAARHLGGETALCNADAGLSCTEEALMLSLGTVSGLRSNSCMACSVCASPAALLLGNLQLAEGVGD